jgi:uncharacterized membrane protein
VGQGPQRVDRARRRIVLAAAGILVVGLFPVAATAVDSTSKHSGALTDVRPGPNPPGEVQHDVSPRLDELPVAPPPAPGRFREHPVYGVPIPGAGGADPVVQDRAGTAAAATLLTNFEGVGSGFTGPQGTFSVTSAPPDPNGAIGPNHYVEVVNSSFAVLDKTGTVLYGPVPTNTLWSGFGGGCQANDDGDATVEYDKLANRWIISQFSITSPYPYSQCIAVSTTGDPTGSYYRYEFGGFGNELPDYPKLGVWPDAYYTTFNLFRNGLTFDGPEICAYDRSKMLLGQTATQQCFVLSTAYGSLLPADLDGSTLPPAGSPNFLLAFGSNVLQLWKFHVDWTTPSNATVTGPTTLPVASFSPACGGDACVPQPGTSQQLDSLGDRLMYRLAYRNFGDHESLVVNHSVTAGSSVGVRWYELRNPNGAPVVYQQGTYAPDGTYRWLGSVAMDHAGNIALGYSASSSTVSPSVRYTGRVAGDPLGTMTQGEGVLLTGTGSQTGHPRWGDYSSMSVDPVDDCTFWYTNEYFTTTGTRWHTRIGSFTLPGCTTAPPSDFSISSAPSSVSVVQGGSGTSTVSTAITSGSAQTVTLSSSGQPSGTTVSFNPGSVNTGGSSTMTINVGAGTVPGPYTITVTGTGATATHTTTVALTVTAAPSDFSIGASPSSVSVAQGASGTSTISTATTNGSAQTVTLTASGQPTGASVGFSPGSVTSGVSSTMTITVGASTAAGTYTLTVTGTGTSATHTTSVSLTVTAATGGNVVANPGFENNLTSWTAGGNSPPTVNGIAHTGANSARVGTPTPFAGDSTLTQTATVPGGSSQLTFWYQPHCTDGIAWDQITMQIRSTSGATLATPLNVCTNGGAWTQVTYDTTSLAGQTIVLQFNVHADGDPNTTYALVDDVSLAGSGPPPPPDFNIAASPSSLSVSQGSAGTTTIATTATGTPQTVGLSGSGQPSGVTLAFSPASVTAGGSSTLTITVGASTVTGTYPLTITGTGTSATHTTTVTLTVTVPSSNAVANGGFELGFSGWTVGGNSSPTLNGTAHTGTNSVRVGTPTPFAGDSTLSQTLTVPGGSSQLTLWYQPHCTDGIAWDQIQVELRSTGGSTLATPLNVCSNSGVWTQLTYSTTPYAGQTIVLRLNVHMDGDPNTTYTLFDDIALAGSGPPPPPDFTIAASPSSVNIAQGASGPSTIATTAIGTPQSVSLSGSGQPSGTTLAFSPASVTAGGSSTLTITVGASTATGTYSLTITGTGTSATHTTTVTLVVSAPGSNAVANGGFELGLSGWTLSGTAPTLSSTAHTGSSSVQVGTPTPFGGDSTLTQTVNVPAGSSQLTVWYQPHCTDGIAWDQIQVELRTTGGSTLATPLNVCSNSGVWTQLTYNTTPYAGQTIVLRLNVHTDGDPNTTYALFDDVALG